MSSGRKHKWENENGNIGYLVQSKMKLLAFLIVFLKLATGKAGKSDQEKCKIVKYPQITAWKFSSWKNAENSREKKKIDAEKCARRDLSAASYNAIYADEKSLNDMGDKLRFYFLRSAFLLKFKGKERKALFNGAANEFTLFIGLIEWLIITVNNEKQRKTDNWFVYKTLPCRFFQTNSMFRV